MYIFSIENSCLDLDKQRSYCYFNFWYYGYFVFLAKRKVSDVGEVEDLHEQGFDINDSTVVAHFELVDWYWL